MGSAMAETTILLIMNANTIFLGKGGERMIQEYQYDLQVGKASKDSVRCFKPTAPGHNRFQVHATSSTVPGRRGRRSPGHGDDRQKI